MAVLTFLLRTMRNVNEEARLIEKFGDEYRAYMKRTGAYFPKFGSRA